jgi:tetratricopeptide (TPR) repeat protein
VLPDSFLEYVEGLLALSRGEWKTSQKLIQEYLVKAKTDNDARRLLARAYFFDGKSREAGLRLQRIIDDHPADLNARMELARVYQLQRKPVLARMVVGEVLTLNPEHKYAWTLMGRLYAKEYSGQEDRQTPEAKKMFEESEKAFLKALDIDSNHSGAHAGLGGLLIDNGQYREAVENFNYALDARPNDILLLLNRANAFGLLGEDANALLDYQKANSIRQDDPLILLDLARCLHRLERYDKAVEHLLQAIRLDSGNSVLYDQLGYAYRLSGNLGKSIEMHTEAMQKDQDHPGYPYGRGLARLEQEEFDLAERDFLLSLKLDPKFRMAHLGLFDVHIGRAEALKDPSRWSEHGRKAVAALKEYLKDKTPGSTDMLRMGRAQFFSGDVKSARDSFTRAIKLNDQNALAYYHRARCHVAEGNPDEAASDFSDSIDRNPDYAEAHYELGAVLSEIKDYESAVDSFSRYTELRPKLAKGWQSRGLVHLLMASVSRNADERSRHAGLAVKDLEKCLGLPQKEESRRQVEAYLDAAMSLLKKS